MQRGERFLLTECKLSSLSKLEAASRAQSCLLPSIGPHKFAITVWYNNRLEFYTMYLFMSIIQDSLVLLRPANWAHSTVNKTPACVHHWYRSSKYSNHVSVPARISKTLKEDTQ